MLEPIYIHGKNKLLPPNQPKLMPKYSYLMVLLEDYTHISEKQELVVTVPEGFMIDGASIPRTLWRLIGSPFLPEFLAAATVHDYLYSQRGTKKQRKVADKIFKEILLLNGISKAKAAVMYSSLRMFGWGPFNKKPKN